MSKLKASEFVSIGHPDKIADYISSYILDKIVEEDPNVRYALEVQIKDNSVSLAGEITTTVERLDFTDWCYDALCEIGYTDEYADKWNCNNVNVVDPRKLIVYTNISKQSPDISQGVNNDGWGDQGIFFGMYNPHCPDGFTMDYYYAREICKKLYYLKVGGIDIKTQVSRCGTIPEVVVAIPFLDGTDHKDEIEKIVRDTLKSDFFSLSVNGTGKYIQHSTIGDCGTTGRKLVCDMYGSGCRIGGGSPWTKDGTKADLTLNLLCRCVARAVAKRTGQCVKVACSCQIGSDTILLEYGGKTQRLKIKPSELVELFQLNKPVFRQLCVNGLFSIVDSIETEKIFALGLA